MFNCRIKKREIARDLQQLCLDSHRKSPSIPPFDLLRTGFKNTEGLRIGHDLPGYIEIQQAPKAKRRGRREVQVN